MTRIVALVVVAILLTARTAVAWPPEVETATFPSPADGSPQKTLVYLPPGDEPVPLLVAFHTWSGDYRQDESPYAAWCIARGWAFLHPDLRGPANRPEAAGGDAALTDLEGALALAQARRSIDPERIYAVGVSGGGMMALLAAARLPETWAAASAWVPVTDLARWHADSKARKNKYTGEIEKVCGGPPGASAEVDLAYAARSVERRLSAGPPACPLDINTGIQDGHTGSVPVGHAVRAFNAVAAPADRVPEAVIEEMEKTRGVPEAWRFAAADALYASRPVLLRTTSGPARLSVFKGGHEIVHEAALTWLEAQVRGGPPVWDVSPHDPPVIGRKAAASGK
jgi:predicted esterase